MKRLYSNFHNSPPCTSCEELQCLEICRQFDSMRRQMQQQQQALNSPRSRPPSSRSSASRSSMSRGVMRSGQPQPFLTSRRDGKVQQEKRTHIGQRVPSAVATKSHTKERRRPAPTVKSTPKKRSRIDAQPSKSAAKKSQPLQLRSPSVLQRGGGVSGYGSRPTSRAPSASSSKLDDLLRISPGVCVCPAFVFALFCCS